MTEDASGVITYNGERYYPIEKAAAYLGMSRAWLYNIAKSRSIPRYTFAIQGKRRYFRERDLDAIRDSPPQQIDGPKTDTATAA